MPSTAREFGDELLRTLLDHAVQGTPAALGAGLVLGTPATRLQRKGEPQGRPTFRVAAAVGVATTLDPAQVAAGQGPLHEAIDKGQVVVLPDPAGHDGDDRSAGPDLQPWPALAGRLDPSAWEGVKGIVVTPGEWGEDLPVVLTMYLTIPPGPDTIGTVDRWEGLLAQALAVVEYCAGEEVRAEQMLQMIQYRRVVEQAKGALMAATGVDAQAAFSYLSRASQHFNVRLRTLAIALVEHVGAGQVEHPDDPDAVVTPSPHDRQVAAQVWHAMTTGEKIGEGADGAS